MKPLIILLLLASVAWGGEWQLLEQVGTWDDSTDTVTISEPTLQSNDAIHTMSFNLNDGTVEIDGQPVEAFSHPELKEILKVIAEQLVQSNSCNYCFRQTDYLLMELEKCLGEKAGD